MAPIRNWTQVFAHSLEQHAAAAVSIRETKRQGILLGEELLARQENILHQQVKIARTLLRNCKAVVTLSYSSTVESLLRHALPHGCRVIIAESRPLMEGRRLFKRLLGGANDLRMITDAQVGLVIPTADLVLVGADTILSDLAVVNKAGTYPAALVAHNHGRGFFVAADTYKINATVNSRNCVLESKSGREVWPRQGNHCENVYFDITPSELVTGFVSEDGLLEPAGMAAHIEHWQRLEKHLVT